MSKYFYTQPDWLPCPVRYINVGQEDEGFNEFVAQIQPEVQQFYAQTMQLARNSDLPHQAYRRNLPTCGLTLIVNQNQPIMIVDVRVVPEVPEEEEEKTRGGVYIRMFPPQPVPLIGDTGGNDYDIDINNWGYITPLTLAERDENGALVKRLNDTFRPFGTYEAENAEAGDTWYQPVNWTASRIPSYSSFNSGGVSLLIDMDYIEDTEGVDEVLIYFVAKMTTPDQYIRDGEDYYFSVTLDGGFAIEDSATIPFTPIEPGYTQFVNLYASIGQDFSALYPTLVDKTFNPNNVDEHVGSGFVPPQPYVLLYWADDTPDGTIATRQDPDTGNTTIYTYEAGVSQTLSDIQDTIDFYTSNQILLDQPAYTDFKYTFSPSVLVGKYEWPRLQREWSAATAEYALWAGTGDIVEVIDFPQEDFKLWAWLIPGFGPDPVNFRNDNLVNSEGVTINWFTETQFIDEQFMLPERVLNANVPIWKTEPYDEGLGPNEFVFDNNFTMYYMLVSRRGIRLLHAYQLGMGPYEWDPDVGNGGGWVFPYPTIPLTIVTNGYIAEGVTGIEYPPNEPYDYYDYEY